jgi:signal transduction histidine kinase
VILTLLVVGASSYRSTVVFSESNQRVQHSHEVLENLQSLLTTMHGVDSNFRGFVITGDDEYLKRYRDGLVRIEQEKTIIGTRTADNLIHQRRLEVVKKLAEQKMQYAETVIGLRRTKGLEAASKFIGTGKGRRLMDEYAGVVHQMQDEELRLLARRTADAARRLNQSKNILIFGTFLGLLIATAAGWSIQRDISTSKNAETLLLQNIEELTRSNHELEQFAYIVAHDLQEPLRTVAGYTQLLSQRYKGKLDSTADEFIGFTVEGASRMQGLIQDLLAYSRVGTKGADLRDISSEDALQQAEINLGFAIEQSRAVVTHDPLPKVLADKTQLVQLFQNLVGNAIKYQSPGVPRVHISAARNGGKQWTFSVKDNGLGIDSQYFKRIFGMFQRLHKREEFSGSGIGLAICKKIVERHGGSISVASELGQGSTFSFALTASERNDEPRRPANEQKRKESCVAAEASG